MKVFASVVVLSLALMGPALAAPVLDDNVRGQKLDQLFQQMKNGSANDALAAEQQIVAIWLSSGDPKIDQQMQVAMQARDNTFYDTALQYFDNIIITKPDYAEAYNQRATLYYMVGNYQASLSDIAQTLALEPRQFGAIAGKGMVELQLGDDQKALDAFQQALAIAPSLMNIQTEVRILTQKLAAQKTNL